MEIKGVFKKTIYNTSTGYIVGLFKIKECDIKTYINKAVTFTGYFHELVIDEVYIFNGDFIEHPKYGEQFNVTKYEKVKPTDKDGVIEFLSSDLFNGIGNSIATSIVNKLGVDALNIILKDENALEDIPKLTKKKALTIRETLKKYEESNETYVYLTEIGFSIKEAMTIYNRYKKRTKDIISNNIYQAIYDIDELTFPKVDHIAMKMGLDSNNNNRIEACIIYVMNLLLFQSGDTYLEYEEIYKNLCSYLKEFISDDDFADYLYNLENAKKIVKYDDKYYITEIFKNECFVADTVVSKASKDKEKYNDIDEYISELENIYNMSYNSDQKEAIKSAIENNILIITGGPGTGKTTIIKAIVDIYKEIKGYSSSEMLNKVALISPTGRASKRMSEATLYPASTIHRYLKWDKESNLFGVDEYNPNKEELIIVDEVSMIDINLFAALLKGINPNAKLILVGDHNQLPSVGIGNVLKDLIDSEVIDTIELEYLYRTKDNSYINILAKEIKDNELSESFMEEKDDFRFLESSEDKISHNLKLICKKLLDKGYDYKRVQIMAPMYHGENGIDNLNKELQTIFNPSDIDKKEYRYNDVIYRENDKVLQLVNEPDLNVFNGDIGIIKNINVLKEEITIDYDGNIVIYKPKDLNKIKHGYIISIHKSQGSEFEFVIIPVCDSYKRMLYRKLIYTGITRAKTKLVLLGSVKSFTYAVLNGVERKRLTTLLDRINNALYKK